MYNLKKNANGDVWYIKKAGSAYVKATMPSGKAEGIIGTGKVKKSDKFEGFEICINEGEYYFAGSIKTDEEKSEHKFDNAKNNSHKRFDGKKRN